MRKFVNGQYVDMTPEEIEEVENLGGVDETNPTESSEDWELIIDYTVEEACAVINITTDINGNEFDLKKAMIIAEIMPNTASEHTVNYSIALALEKKITKPYTNASVFKLLSVPKPTETVSTAMGIYELIGDTVHNTAMFIGFNKSNVAYSLVNNTAYTIGESMEPGKIQSTAINALNLQTTGDYIGAGSTIKMYGIRKEV